ncbi:type IX secretion system membrane protein PorP/SprF [Algibacter amylolyticus]|uniref:Type IX secretion system membrane protein PorP/SprF n=1 Tax=Algibacter amylolyticus TaxID=1608400 RepID=A0A5M7BJV9_9FLAO|nr:type IX secretion system membrane protein PorP/SprF [Algibacter amylolyticus]KAA5827814.1 type IX secretion system membrane protein PorP/SprF [Algibacter amylolyticus]MBB5267042.1 type IX secretion system PorP/SprF family membrane protein [Algibacter amylolyticus]TSJ82059.1 type IX secretion system membrane protein PorP/SprF [Algibacter amylolyticus]
MNFRTIILVAITAVFSNIATAQEGLPIYTDYLTDNYYLIHPSMAGIANCSKVRLTGRQQWFGHDDAPKLTTLSVNGRIGESQSAIGGIVYADNNGYHSQKGAYLTYAHHLMFSRSEADLNMLSFGLSAGFIQYQLDETTFLDGTPIPDPIIDGVVQNETNFNVDLGFSYHYLDFYAHGTVKNLLNNSGVNSDLEITSNLRRYLFSVGNVFSRFGSDWSYEPSVMFQYRDLTKESSIDFNGKVYKEMEYGKLWGGASYRQSLDGAEYLDGSSVNSQKLNQVTGIIGANYNNYMFAYTYTYQTNPIVFTSGGFHQITLGYNFGCRRKKYACNCPAVN